MSVYFIGGVPDAGRWTIFGFSRLPSSVFCFKPQASSLKLPASGPKPPTSTQRQPEVLTSLAFITFCHQSQAYFDVLIVQVTQSQASMQVVSGILQIIQE